MNETAIFEFIVDILKEREEIVLIDAFTTKFVKGKPSKMTLFIFTMGGYKSYVPLLIDYTDLLRPLEAEVEIQLLPLHIDTRYKFTNRLPELKTIYKKDDNT